MQIARCFISTGNRRLNGFFCPTFLYLPKAFKFTGGRRSSQTFIILVHGTLPHTTAVYSCLVPVINVVMQSNYLFMANSGLLQCLRVFGIP